MFSASTFGAELSGLKLSDQIVNDWIRSFKQSCHNIGYLVYWICLFVKPGKLQFFYRTAERTQAKCEKRYRITDDVYQGHIKVRSGRIYSRLVKKGEISTLHIGGRGGRGRGEYLLQESVQNAPKHKINIYLFHLQLGGVWTQLDRND